MKEWLNLIESNVTFEREEEKEDEDEDTDVLNPLSTLETVLQKLQRQNKVKPV
jgi:hypothetical protein